MLYVRAATSDVACGNGDARIIGRHRNLSELLQSSVHTLTPAYLQQELPAGDRVVAAVRGFGDTVAGGLRGDEAQKGTGDGGRGSREARHLGLRGKICVLIQVSNAST